MDRRATDIYEFGPFRLLTSERVLLKNGQPVPITPKAYEVLFLLVENRGHLVDKADLMKQVWPDTFVEEYSLTRNISTLRKVLGDDGNGNRYIETVPRRGYRFFARVKVLPISVAEVSNIEALEPKQDGKVDEAAGRRGSGKQAGKKYLLQSAIGAVAVVVLAAAVYYFWLRNSPKPIRNTAIKSIAVLPFKPMTTENRDEALEMGMTDTLITRLSNLREITVLPISTVRKYTSLEQDSVAIGRELKIDAVVDGSIQRDGEKIRVTTRLVRVEDGAVLWSDKCDDRCTNIFEVQDAISNHITHSLALKLASEETNRLTRHYTENVEAYQLYIQGRYHWNKRKADAIAKAIGFFNQAIEKDPTYALAYAGLADCYIVYAAWSILPPHEAFSKARAATINALELDETLAEAHTSLAVIKARFDWDWPECEKEFRRAIELKPNYATVHHWYSIYLTMAGRHDEAITEIKRAWELDPFSLQINKDKGNAYFYARQYDQAIEQFRKTLEMDNGFDSVYAPLVLAYYLKGMHKEAFAELSQSDETAQGIIYGLAGKRSEAEKILKRFGEETKHGYIAAYEFALLYAALRESDLTLEWLEKAFAERSVTLPYITVEPFFDYLRSDPRFANLISRVGLPQQLAEN